MGLRKVFYLLCCTWIVSFIFPISQYLIFYDRLSRRGIPEVYEPMDHLWLGSVQVIKDKVEEQMHPADNVKGATAEHSYIYSSQGLFLKADDVYDFPVEEFDCDKLFSGDKQYIKNVSLQEFNDKKDKSTLFDKRQNCSEYCQYLIDETQNCTDYKTKSHYLTKPVSKLEEDFPIAFSIVMYKDPDQVERLLRAIYRPQNYYCIHVDLEAKKEVYESMLSLSRCFHNVFIPQKRARVRWASYTVLESEFFCMEALMKYKSWKYFINLTGQEFPILTNWDIVRILRTFNGANNVGGSFER